VGLYNNIFFIFESDPNFGLQLTLKIQVYPNTVKKSTPFDQF